MKKLALIVGLLVIVFLAQGQNNGYVSKIKSYIILQGDTVRFDDSQIDGEVIKRIGGVWTNGTGGAGSAAVDSLFRYPDGRIGWYISGSIAGDIVKDSTNVAVSDTLSGGAYYSQNQVEALIVALADNPFTLNMPAATTVQGRIDGMVEGVDYPTGWTLTASGLDLIVVHNLSRQIADVTILTNTAGDIWQQLTGTSAFSALYSSNSDNTCQISSLATVNLPINVNIFFAQ